MITKLTSQFVFSDRVFYIVSFLLPSVPPKNVLFSGVRGKEYSSSLTKLELETKLHGTLWMLFGRDEFRSLDSAA